MLLGIVLGLFMTQSSMAWNLTALRTWYTQKGNTGFEVRIQDRDWQVTNRSLRLYFYNNQRQQLASAYVVLRDGYLTNDTRSSYHAAVSIAGNNIKIRGFLKGKKNISTVRAQL